MFEGGIGDEVLDSPERVKAKGEVVRAGVLAKELVDILFKDGLHIVRVYRDGQGASHTSFKGLNSSERLQTTAVA